MYENAKSNLAGIGAGLTDINSLAGLAGSSQIQRGYAQCPSHTLKSLAEDVEKGASEIAFRLNLVRTSLSSEVTLAGNVGSATNQGIGKDMLVLSIEDHLRNAAASLAVTQNILGDLEQKIGGRQ